MLAWQSLVAPQGSSGGAEPHPYHGPRESWQNYKRYFGILQWGRGLAPPPFAAPAKLGIYRCTLSGPAMQAPTGKGQSWRGNECVYAGIKLAREALRSVRRSILKTAYV